MLVTRPEPDNARTAQALRARGRDALLAPVLRCEFLPVVLPGADDVGAVVVTSANALRAIAGDPGLPPLTSRPLFAVGEHTGRSARAMGFADVRVAAGDVVALIALLAAQATGPLLYIAGEETTRDLGAEMAKHGLAVRTINAYRMIAAPGFPADVKMAVREGRVEAVLHYSRRSARIFAELAADMPRALAVPQCCLSQVIAEVLRAAGAAHVVSAPRPREPDLLDLLDRTLAQAQK